MPPAIAYAAAVATTWVASSPATLSWDGPSGCPGDTEVRDRVAALLGDRWPEDEIAVRARARRDADGLWSVTLAIESDEGLAEREIEGASSCAAAAEATAVVVAIALEPQLRPSSEALLAADEPPSAAATTEVPASPQPEATTSLPALADAESIPPPDPRLAPAERARPHPSGDDGATDSDRSSRHARRRTSWARGALGLAPQIQIGTLPGVAGGGRVWGALLLPRVRFGLATAAVGSAPIRPPSARVLLWRWTIEAEACAVFPIGERVELDPCLEIETGVTLAGVSGLTDPRSPRPAWLAFAAQPTLGIRLTRRLALMMGARLVVPVIRHRYVVDGYGAIYRPGPVGGSALAGLEVRIP